MLTKYDKNLKRSTLRINISTMISKDLAPDFDTRVKAVNMIEIIHKGGTTIKEAVDFYFSNILQNSDKKKTA